ncbi:MAG: valine--tRNA ligase [Alphaproteobacteria bacterium]|nr:MAG: valine--tRNA ligase [Alphaproteobacteria bacterium]
MPMDKTFDAARAEPEIYAAWEAAGAFRAGANARPGAESFCIMIPPPNVTGSLHMGHAFNNTLQDILIRWHRMRGFDTLWQPGTDHAGIATQMVVERQLAAEGNLTRREMGREAFVRKVWEWKEHYGDRIVTQLKRLGASCDWDRTAFTMAGAPGDTRKGHENSPNFHDAVLKVFVDLYNAGLIYRGKRLVNWDPHFETAISDLEVENVEVDGFMWHFKYPLQGGQTYEYVERDENGNVTLRETRDYISIATTRPETMLGDGAVAVHPSDKRYAPIVGKLCEIPVGPREHRRLIPIITDPYPDPDFGSGAVKITGAHDFNDYAVARRNNIPMYRLMDMRGHMRDDGAPYAECAARAQEIAEGAEFTEAEVDTLNLVPDDLRGLDRFEARRRVVEQITAEGLAVTTRADDPRLGRAARKPGAEGAEAEVPLVEAKRIMAPFGDRSKVIIEPMLTDQWFVDAGKLARAAIAAVEDGRTAILPEQHRKVYFNWMRDIEPWCISRQLWWGHQIPVWYDEDGNQYSATSEAEAVAMAGGRPLTRDPDVLDTWFSSALWPFGTLGWPEETPELKRYYPTNVLVTGFDIIFFWVARMMMMGLHFMREVPFHTVYVHALVRDEKGKKMSKSLGNVMDPLDLIDKYGADAVRFTLASMAAMGRDLKLSEARVAGYGKFVTKLWNAARLAEMNRAKPVPGFDPAGAAEPLNRWIAGETARAGAAVDGALKSFRFNDAANGLYAFVWGRVCDWYLELAKPLLADGHPAQAETRATLAWVIDRCLILLHPFMPFVTEALWGQIASREKMLIHADWPEGGAEDPEADREIGWVIGLIEEIRSVRAEMNVAPGAKVPLVIVEAGAAEAARLEAHAALIARLARVPQMIRADAPPRGAVTLSAPGATLCLPLGDVVDIAAEKARLEKASQKLEKEIGGLSAKLSNEKFLARAPEEVVEEQRERLEAAQSEAGRLKAALGRLAEMA